MSMKIVIGGREYHSRDELPAELREHYDRAAALLADKNGNGVPDVLEGTVPLPKFAAGAAPVAVYAQRLVVNGREYNSLDELPPDLRRQMSDQVATALARADPLAGLPPSTPMLTFDMSSSDGSVFSITSFWLVLGGILIGLFIAIGVLAAMGQIR